MSAKTLAKAFMPSGERDFEQSDGRKWEIPKRASEFVMLVQSLISAEDVSKEGSEQLLERYNEVIDRLHDQEVFEMVVSAIGLMERSLVYAKAKGDNSSKKRITDFQREIALVYGFLADHSSNYSHFASIKKLLALENDDECVVAAISESLVKHLRSKEEMTDADEELLTLIEDLVEDFVEKNRDIAIAYKIRSDVSLAGAIFLQKSEAPDSREIEGILEEAKIDALRAVSIDHNGKYDDHDIDLFKLDFPDIVDEILNEEHRWRRS